VAAEQPTASIVICTWRMRDLITRCLETVTAEAPSDWEVIVVVNGNEDGTVAVIRARFPQVRLIVNPRNRGVGPARNQGMAIARAPFVILLDADTTVTPGSLTGLVDALERAPDVAVIGPRLVSPSGERQGTARDFPTLLTKLRRRLPARIAAQLPADAVPDGDRPLAVGYVIGACQAVRRAALEQVGPLDEAIFYGPEDVDLCLRMWKAGWKVVWDPRFTIVHHEQRLTRRRVLSTLTVRHAIALAYFFRKHGYLFRPPTYGAHPRLA
jgi:GT2 family glycosyltransferase